MTLEEKHRQEWLKHHYEYCKSLNHSYDVEIANIVRATTRRQQPPEAGYGADKPYAPGINDVEVARATNISIDDNPIRRKNKFKSACIMGGDHDPVVMVYNAFCKKCDCDLEE